MFVTERPAYDLDQGDGGILTNPLVIFLIIASPVALVVLIMLWRRSRTMSVDPWYVGSPVSYSSWVPAADRPSLSNSRRRAGVPQENAEANGLELCKKVLFCWDYWSSGKSGLNLQDVFEARSLPAELRAVVNEAQRKADSIRASFR